MILTTACSLMGNFMVYLKVMVYSLKNSGLNPRQNPLYIFHDGIIPEDEAKLKKMWNVKLIMVDHNIYVKKGKDNPKFWAFESFNPVHFRNRSNVLFLDCDLLITQDIRGIKKYFNGITMMRERGRACYNAGVVCINENQINSNAYKSLLGYTMNWNEFGNDQQALNSVYNHKISELPKFYNMLVGEQDEFGNLEDVGIVHYIHKPDATASQERIGQKYLDLWNNHNEGMNNV